MVDLVKTPNTDDIIVDIRHPDEVAIRPLSAQQILLMPFFKIANLKLLLSPRKRYLLYCEQGTMSRIQAELLAEQGHSNIHVFIQP